MPQEEGVDVTGPDGKSYQFPAGTTKEQAIGYFKTKGIGAAPAATPAPTAQPPAPSVDAQRQAVQQKFVLPKKQPSTMSKVRSGIKAAFPYVAEPVKGVASTLAGIASYPFQASGVRPGDEKMGPAQYMPNLRLLNHMYGDFMGGVDNAANARDAAKRGGEGLIGQTLASAEKMPVIGPMVERAEKGAVTPGPGMSLKANYFTPQQLRAAAEALTFAKTPAVVNKASGMVSAEAWYARAAKLDNKVFQTAKGYSRDYNLSAALQVAKEGVYGNLATLPDKIEVKQLAKQAEVQQVSKQLTGQGVEVDISQKITPTLRRIATVANNRGQLNEAVIGQLRKIGESVSTQRDMQTGAIIPRNLAHLTIDQALELTKGLGESGEFGKTAPTIVQQAARELRQAINDEIGAKAPQIQKLRAEQSKLITERDAARENYAKALNDGRTMAKGFVYSNMPSVTAYLAMKALGLPFGEALGGLMVLRTLAESAVSRTFRAAMYAKIGKALDSLGGANASPQGPSGGGAPGTGLVGPKGPQVPPQQQLTAKAGGGPPFAQATPVYTNPPNSPSWRGPAAPRRIAANATRARAGSGDYVTPEKMEARKAGPPSQRSPMADAQAAIAEIAKTPAKARPGDMVRKIMRARVAMAALGGEGADPPPKRDIWSAVAHAEVEKLKGEEVPFHGSKPSPLEDIGILGNIDTMQKERGNVAKSNTTSPTKEVPQHPEGKPSPGKIMLDRLDVLVERQAHPKSGADRVAIEREIAQIKRILSGEDLGTKNKGEPKRIADRERLAAKRAGAKAASPGANTAAPTGSTAEPATRPDASPENRAMLLDMGYKKLASYEGGPAFVKGLQDMARDMQKAGVKDYDEVTALTDALKALQEVEGK